MHLNTFGGWVPPEPSGEAYAFPMPPSRNGGKGKVNGVQQFATSLTATGTHVPHGITQCYLPPGRDGIHALTPAEAGTRLSDPVDWRGRRKEREDGKGGGKRTAPKKVKVSRNKHQTDSAHCCLQQVEQIASLLLQAYIATDASIILWAPIQRLYRHSFGRVVNSDTFSSRGVHVQGSARGLSGSVGRVIQVTSRAHVLRVIY